MPAETEEKNTYIGLTIGELMTVFITVVFFSSQAFENSENHLILRIKCYYVVMKITYLFSLFINIVVQVGVPTDCKMCHEHHTISDLIIAHFISVLNSINIEFI
jgi:hypothetical protein